MKKIGILGSGIVGKTLAQGFIKNGYQVIIASRTPSKLEEWKNQTGNEVKTGTFEETAKFGNIIVLATKGTAALEALKLAGENSLENKTIIDATNPIADLPPDNGVLRFFTNLDKSLMEKLQENSPKANFVKAFNSVGSAFMVDPDFNMHKPTMFICGNNDHAKNEVKEILDLFGWETEDMGSAEAARAIEPLCMLWCIPGFRENRWNHAFKLIKSS